VEDQFACFSSQYSDETMFEPESHLQLRGMSLKANFGCEALDQRRASQTAIAA
jgi:hypothetical protein